MIETESLFQVIFTWDSKLYQFCYDSDRHFGFMERKITRDCRLTTKTEAVTCQ